MIFTFLIQCDRLQGYNPLSCLFLFSSIAIYNVNHYKEHDYMDCLQLNGDSNRVFSCASYLASDLELHLNYIHMHVSSYK